MKLNLQRKITLVMWTLSAASTLVAALLIGNLLIRSHQNSLRKQLQSTAAILISLGISDFSHLRDFDDLDTFIEDALGMGRVNRIIRIFDKAGNLVYSTIGTDSDTLSANLKIKSQSPHFIELRGKGRRYEGLVMSYQTKGSHQIFYLQVIAPLPRYRQIFHEIWWQSLLLFGLLLIFSLFLSRWLTQRLLKPVENLGIKLQEMNPHQIEEWEPLEMEAGGTYLKAITFGINSLIKKTKETLFQLKKMSRYVAHEMRTPLTILQGEAETLLLKSGATLEDYQVILKSSLEEVQKLSQTVDSILQMGAPQGREQRKPKIKILSLDQWLYEKIPPWEKILNRKIGFSKSKGKSWEINSDPELLFLLLDNLIRNIKKHTPEQTSCRFTLFQDENKILLRLEDSGKGLSPRVLKALNQKIILNEITGVGLHLCNSLAEALSIEMNFFNLNKGGLGILLKFKQ